MPLTSSPLDRIEVRISANHSHPQAKAQFKRRSTANNVSIIIPVPDDADTPRFRTNIGTVHYAPETSSIVWKIKQFGGGKEFLMRAELGLPSVRGDDDKGGGMMGGFGGSMGGVTGSGKGKRPIQVKFEIPYFTTSGIQVRYLKIIEPKVCIAALFLSRIWALLAGDRGQAVRDPCSPGAYVCGSSDFAANHLPCSSTLGYRLPGELVSFENEQGIPAECIYVGFMQMQVALLRGARYLSALWRLYLDFFPPLCRSCADALFCSCNIRHYPGSAISHSLETLLCACRMCSDVVESINRSSSGEDIGVNTAVRRSIRRKI